MAKVTLQTITAGYASVDLLNANFSAIATALENTLSRDGTSPNTMSANLDMNSNRVVNLPSPSTSTEPVRLIDVQNGSISSTEFVVPDQTGHSAKALGTDGSVASWRHIADLLGTALSASANKLPYFDGATSMALTDFTAAARALLDDADAASMRTTLGVGTGDSPTLTGLTLSGTALSVGGSSIPYLGGIGKNAIINGEFTVWQRGINFTSVTSGAYTADRWQYAKSGSMVHNIERLTGDTPTVAQAGRFTDTCLLVDCTTVDGTIAAGDYAVVQQIVEGYNFLPLAQRPFTLSFWHKHTKTGTYCVAFKNSAADRSYVAEYTQDVSDTWEKATVTVTASPSAGTWDYTNGIGLTVAFAIAAGTTLHTTANAWQSGNYAATANQVNACDSTSNNFKLALVQLEAGSVATEFEARTYEHELALCQRYFEKSFGAATAPANGTGTQYWSTVAVCHTTNGVGAIVNFQTRKRTLPTMALYNNDLSTSGNPAYFWSGAWQSGSSPSYASGGTEIMQVAVWTTSGVSVGEAVRASFNWTASAEL